MFGMDWVSIIAAGIAGAAGALLGGLLGALLPESAKNLRIILVVALAVSAPTFAKPYIEPYVETQLGPTLRAGQFEAVFESELVPAFKKIPALERIFRDFPDTEKKFRDKAREAYEAGGAKGLVEASGGIGAEVLGEAFMTYMPRARREDLMLFATSMAETFSMLNEKDPEACILHQFGTNYGRPLGNSRLLAAIGKEGQQRLLAAMNAIVVNAGDKPVTYDKAKADSAVGALAQRHAPLLTGKSAEVASGSRPPANVEEAKAACSFAVALFKDLVSIDPNEAELVMRHLFAASP